jgi:hypothetical protein
MFLSHSYACTNKRLYEWFVAYLQACLELIGVRLVTAQDLWKTITSVSNAGAKRGRAKRRGATKFKDLNFGQRLGQGTSLD